MKQFSFTKKGPGRIHNNIGTDKRFLGISNMQYELALRNKYGRISESYIKRWDKQSKNMTVTGESVMKKIIDEFKKLLRK